MERLCVTLGELDRHGARISQLLFREHGLDGVHVAGQPGDRQQRPAMGGGGVRRQPFSRETWSRAMPQVKWATGLVRVQ